MRHGDVACVQPAPGEGGFGGRLVFEVATHDYVATHEDLRGREIGGGRGGGGGEEREVVGMKVFMHQGRGEGGKEERRKGGRGVEGE